MFIADKTDLTMNYIFSGEEDTSLYIHNDDKRIHTKFMEKFLGVDLIGFTKTMKRYLNISETILDESLSEDRQYKHKSEKYRVFSAMGCLPYNHLYIMVSEEGNSRLKFCVSCGKELHKLNTAFEDEYMCEPCEKRIYKPKESIFIKSLKE